MESDNCTTPGFGVTYEGLKPDNLPVKNWYTICFGVTYEGLKRDPSSFR